MWYLSFDCANKSLAVGLYEISDRFKEDIKECISLYQKCEYEIVKEKIKTIIRIAYTDVYDVIPNQKVKDIDIVNRTRKFKEVVQKINDKNTTYLNNNLDIVQVCIEYQMNVNDKSRTVYNQLIYEYADASKYNVIIMKPLLKNTIYLSESLKYCYIIEKYNSVYRCNKQHSKINFLYFIDTFRLNDKIKHIHKKNIDDVADTFMQVIAYLLL